ncbi:unnamed protein product, partial [Rotaria magnacalcarata]
AFTRFCVLLDGRILDGRALVEGINEKIR